MDHNLIKLNSIDVDEMGFATLDVTQIERLYKSTCSCGWTSGWSRSMLKNETDFDEHVKSWSIGVRRENKI